MITIRFKLNQCLSSWVLSQVGGNAPYRSHNDYVEDLIRQDMRARSENYTYEKLDGYERAELNNAAHQGVTAYERCRAGLLNRKPGLKDHLLKLDGELMPIAQSEDGLFINKP